MDSQTSEIKHQIFLAQFGHCNFATSCSSAIKNCVHIKDLQLVNGVKLEDLNQYLSIQTLTPHFGYNSSYFSACQQYFTNLDGPL